MLHAVPTKDLRPHRCDTTCECEPKVEFLKEIVVTHNSYDRREEHEPEVLGAPGVLVQGDCEELIDV
jgi:hypothetical protein